MKILLISSTLLVTSGTSTYGLVNNLNAQPSSLTFPQTQEISSKNISELSSITTLKNANKIEELTPSSIDNLKNIDASLDTYYSSSIYALYSSQQSDVTVANNSIKLHQKTLGDLYKTQIDLSTEHKIYEDVKSHFNSSAPTNSNLEIAKDTSSSSSACKIQKKTSVGTPPVPPTDNCSYGWQILSISVEDKIDQILTVSAPTPPSDLSSRYQTLKSSKIPAP